MISTHPRSVSRVLVDVNTHAKDAKKLLTELAGLANSEMMAHIANYATLTAEERDSLNIEQFTAESARLGLLQEECYGMAMLAECLEYESGSFYNSGLTRQIDLTRPDNGATEGTS